MCLADLPMNTLCLFSENLKFYLSLSSINLGCLVAHSLLHNSPKPDTPYPTRESKIDLPLPKSTSACGHRKPNYQASDAWNGLPNPLWEIKHPQLFKVALKQHLLATLV